MRILVVGKGMLGCAFLNLSSNISIYGIDKDTVDIRNIGAVRNCIEQYDPDIVINAAGYTDVDGAEINPITAFTINADGAANVAKAAKEGQAVSVYFSTDYVFDGTKGKPYVEEDEPNPVGVYARSKRMGEIAVLEADPSALVIRTAWLYGANGRNFVGTMLKLADQDEIRVVADQRGSPTWTHDLVLATLKLVLCGASGIVHVTNSGNTTWYEFAHKIFEIMGKEINVVPITTEELNRPARRPAYSVLDNSAYTQITGDTMPAWEDGLRRFMGEFVLSVI